MRRIAAVLGATTIALLAPANAASADTTLGTTTLPSGATAHGCGAGDLFAQSTSVGADSSTVPAGATGGHITQWRVGTTGAAPGSSIELLVLETTGSNDTVTAVDSETIPNPLPASGVASFTPPTPLAVTPGEVLGVFVSSGTVDCYWNGGSTPAGDVAVILTPSGTPTVGQVLPVSVPSPGGYQLNLAASLGTALDAGVRAGPSPAMVTVGNLVLLSLSVTNGGPASAPITLTDAVPAGLTIGSAVAGSGTCATSAQQVTCTISGLASGASAPVNIILTPTVAGTYTNSVAVASGVSDPNPANNTASATFTASAPRVTPAARCTVPTLTGTPLGVSTRLLVLLNCKSGKVAHAFGGKVAKGTVIKTTPTAGSYPNGTPVSLLVSSGPKPKKKRHKRR